MNVKKWLLASDPSIRWQAMRDLADEPPAVYAAERRRVATEGWGARLLGLQAPSGPWYPAAATGASGKAASDPGWMATIYHLTLLADLGADPDGPEVARAIERVRSGVRWHQLDGRPFFEGETEPCLNGGILAAGAAFGHASDALAERLLGEQLADGGWNCDAPPSVRSSFHTTICVLEGLLAYERSHGGVPAVRHARLRAHEFLLERRLFRSLRTGEAIDRRWLRFSFPTRWHYDVLRGLDYLRDAGAEPDDRIAEAIAAVRERRHQNGLWPLNVRHKDLLTPDLEPGPGKPSAWITLRALRVLRWAGVAADAHWQRIESTP